MATTSNKSRVTKGTLTYYDEKVKEWTKQQIPSVVALEERVTTVESAYRAAEKSISDIDDAVNGEAGIATKVTTLESQINEEMTTEDVDALFTD